MTIKLLLLSILLGLCLSLQNTTVCSTIINQTNPTIYCSISNKTCTFLKGLNLINSTTEQYFSLCILLPDFDITIGDNAVKDDMQGSVYIEGANITLAQNYSLMNDLQVVLVASDTITTMNETYLSAGLVWMQAPQIIILQSRIQNISSIQSQCSCYDQSSTCTKEWDLDFPKLWNHTNSTVQYFNASIFGATYNYTMIKHNSIIMYGQNLVYVENSSLISSIVGMFANNVTIVNDSLISTTGNGFPSATGRGCGYFDEILNQLLGCTGSGGSYGGFGGNSWPDNCNLMISRPPYELNEYPSTPGSGGGFFLAGIKQASSGGGVINIQGNTIDIWNSSVQAKGKSGTQGGGGGSGGSVALDYTQIAGNSNISADGGNGQSSGGGGRLWLWNHNWRYQQYNAFLSQFTITARGGIGCYQLLSCGQNGSIATSPCQPGFQLNMNNFICEYCSTGSYQNQYGYAQCQPCRNRPANSQYISSNNSNLFSSVCSYSCSNYLSHIKIDSTYILVNGQCLSSFIYIINTVGGVNMMISVGIIVCAVIVYLIIVLFQKLTEKELFNEKKEQDPLQRRMHFRVEDVPFHQKRIYFTGSNSPSRPWHISQNTKDAYKRHAVAPITKLDHILSKLCKQTTSICRYSKAYTLLMNFLKFYYYPLYRYIEQLYRVEKSQQISRLVVQTNKKIPETQNLAIKFHVSPYCTVGCLQIFNYNKSALDFYIQNYFPIYFMLQKMPLGGYAIDLNDPFMKAFISEIDHKDTKPTQTLNFIMSSSSSSKVYQKYIIQLDQLLRNTEQLIPILNHLWMMTEYNPAIQVYLYQHGGNILGVETYYTINPKQPLFLVFSSQNNSKHQFISQQPLKNIYHHSVEYFNNQYKFRQQVTHDDKKSVFWELENSFNQKFLSWSLGILTIFILLQVVIEFFILIFVQAEKEVQFTYGIVVYFVVLPFSEFFSVYLCFRLILSKNCKILADSLYFTVGNICKLLIVIVMGMIVNIDTDFSNILMCIIFYLWILSLISNIISLLLKLLLHWHYSRHHMQNQNINQSEKKKKKKKLQ